MPHVRISALSRAERGGILAARELVEIGLFLKALEMVKTSFANYEYSKERFPLLQQYIAGLTLFPMISSQLERTFMDSGEIRENATPVLYSLKREEKICRIKFINVWIPICAHPIIESIFRKTSSLSGTNAMCFP